MRNLFPILTLVMLLSNACAGPQTLRKSGLSYLAVGDSMPRLGRTELEGFPLTESTVHENGYAWRVCTLGYPGGMVFVESDFTSQKMVNRIRVETPDLKVKGGLRVGQQLHELIDKTNSWKARPFPAYRLIEMTSPKYPRMVFLLNEKGFDYSQEVEQVELSELSGTSKLVGIVVW